MEKSRKSGANPIVYRIVLLKSQGLGEYRVSVQGLEVGEEFRDVGIDCEVTLVDGMG